MLTPHPAPVHQNPWEWGGEIRGFKASQVTLHHSHGTFLFPLKYGCGKHQRKHVRWDQELRCVDARVPGAALVRALRSDLGQSSERQFLDYKLTVSASPD